MKIPEKKPRKDWHSERTEQQPEIFPSPQSPAFRFLHSKRREREGYEEGLNQSRRNANMPFGDGRQPGLNRGLFGDPEGLFEWLLALTKIIEKHLICALTALLCLYVS